MTGIPTSPTPITEGDLNAYADARLNAVRRAELEAHLALNPEAAARVAAYQRQNAELRECFAPVLSEPIPERLSLAAQRFLRMRRAGWAAGLVAAGLCAGLAAGGFAGWTLHGESQLAGIPARNNFVRDAAVAHAVYSPEVRHPVEVGADQEAHLVTWLSKRLGTAIRAPKLDSAGLSLVGGRLLPGEKGTGGEIAPTAQFMYQCPKGRRVTLYVRAEGPDSEETAFRYTTEGNVGVFYWIDRRFGYAMSSSDMSKDELLNLANVAYRQLNP